MAKQRLTKKEKFINEHFEITSEDDSFIFIPKEGSGYKEAFIEGVSSEKAASEALYDAIHEEEKTEEKQPKEKSKGSTCEDVLMNLVKKYPTDKLDHGYIPIYAKKLPKSPKSVLEIGCYKGDSVRMWREFFPEETKIAALDLFEEYDIPDVDGVQFFKGSQSDEELLDFIAGHDFDVVIDDGSHGARDQWLTVEKFLKPGTMVVIEDLHCNFDGNGFWNQGLPESETILGKIKAGTFPHKHELFLDKIVFIFG